MNKTPKQFVRRQNGVVVVAEMFEPRLMLSGTGNLAFDDEFNQAAGTQPSTAVWVRDVSSDPNNGAVHYTNATDTLAVVADSTATDGKALAMTLYPTGNVYNSSRISTQLDPIGNTLQYGQVSARIRIPSATNAAGVWPAFWMLGNNINSVSWPESGETDIMENKGSTPGQIQGSLHAGSVTNSPDYNPTAADNLPAGQVFSSAYHIFAANWTPTSISFSVDGVVYETQNISSTGVPGDDVGRFQHPFYILLNIAEGGSFAGGSGGTQFKVTAPTTMYIDYVRVSGYQLSASPSTMPSAPAFSDSDIGAPGLAGSANFDGVGWTIKGAGSDIFNSSDQFNFASQSITGDVTEIAQINTITNSANFAKAGIMIRDGSAANASYAFAFVNPNNSVAGEGANFEFRNGAGTASQSANSVAGVTAPEWVKLVRAGNVFTAFNSTDGVTWTQNGPSESIAMGSTVRVGLAVSSNSTTTLNTALFSHVDVLPGTWNDADIGSPNGQGSAAVNAAGTTWTVDGGGADIWNNADQFNFASQNLGSDGSIIAQVTSLANTNTFAKAGVMLRNDSTAGSLFANVDVTVGQGVTFQWRSTAGALPTAVTVAGVATPLWVEVTRAGNSFRGFYSNNGTSWTQIGTTQTIAMGSTTMAGMAVSAHDNFTINQATFTNVSLASTPFASLSTSNLNVNFQSTGDSIALSTSGGNITATENGQTISFPGVSGITVTFASGIADTLTVNGTIVPPVSFVGGGTLDTLNVASGGFTLAAPGIGSGIITQTFGALSIASGAKVALATSTSHTDRNVLVLGALTIAGSIGNWQGLLDLGGNDMIVKGGSATAINDQLKQGFNIGGASWSGTNGIISSAAAGNTQFLTALGVMQGNGTSFEGTLATTSDVIVKYTYYGDADLNGILNGADYQQIDLGFGSGLIGWVNGDFNYDGVVNGSDFALIDNTYNQITATAASALALTAKADSVVVNATPTSHQPATPFAAKAASAINVPIASAAGEIFGPALDDIWLRPKHFGQTRIGL